MPLSFQLNLQSITTHVSDMETLTSPQKHSPSASILKRARPVRRTWLAGVQGELPGADATQGSTDMLDVSESTASTVCSSDVVGVCSTSLPDSNCTAGVCTAAVESEAPLPGLVIRAGSQSFDLGRLIGLTTCGEENMQSGDV